MQRRNCGRTSDTVTSVLCHVYAYKFSKLENAHEERERERDKYEHALLGWTHIDANFPTYFKKS
jgi:hypothetical protein